MGLRVQRHQSHPPYCQLRNDLHVQPPERWRCCHLQKALKLRPPPQILHREAEPRASGERQGFPSGSATYRAWCKSERLAAGWGHQSGFHLRPSGEGRRGAVVESKVGKTNRRGAEGERHACESRLVSSCNIYFFYQLRLSTDNLKNCWENYTFSLLLGALL